MNTTLWPEVRIGEILSYTEELIKLDDLREYITITVKRRHGGLEPRERLFGHQIRTKKQYRLIPGAFLISRIQCWHQAYAIVPEDIPKNMIASTNYDQFIISPKVDHRFFWWFSHSPLFTETVRSSAFGVVIEKMVFDRDAWLEKKIPLPPLTEQQCIVSRIEELSANILQAKKLREEIYSEQGQLLSTAFTKVIRNANWLPMKEVAPLVRRPVKVDPLGEYNELGIRSFGKGTFHKPSVTGASLGDKRIFAIEPNDLVFNIVFAWEGAVAVARSEDHGRVGSHRFLTCVPKDGLALSALLCFHFLTDRGLEDLGAASPGGAGRNRTLGLEALAKIPVPVPPIEKQHWFVSLLEKTRESDHLRLEVDRELGALMPSILAKAFRGEL